MKKVLFMLFIITIFISLQSEIINRQYPYTTSDEALNASQKLAAYKTTKDLGRWDK